VERHVSAVLAGPAPACVRLTYRPPVVHEDRDPVAAAVTAAREAPGQAGHAFVQLGVRAALPLELERDPPGVQASGACELLPV
jgi:hypothetical protein